MTDYASYFKYTEAEHTFFAGANTPHGFVSDYGSLLCEDTFSKVYIIKGGSGTGKSTLMRKSVDAATQAGAKCIQLLCGSDPDSLDGVIIEKNGIKIAVIDGTAPHMTDPVYAGACGEIINCGDYWEATLLEKKKQEIAAITSEKKLAYAKTYRYLRAASELLSLQQKNASVYILSDKMGKCVSRIASSSGTTPRKIHRRTQCLSMKGAFRLSSLENEAEHVVSVRDFASLSPVFFSLLAGEFIKRGNEIVVSESPLFGVCEIYVPSTGTAYVPEYEDRNYERTVNLQRFADREELAKIRQKQRFSGKCLTAMLDGAMACLSEIGKAHFNLEDIYKPAMDFDGLDKLTSHVCEKIVTRLNSP